MNDSFIELQRAEQDTAKPTEKQAIAQNYRKGRLELHGLKIAIENPRFSLREGKDANGKAWSNLMQATYGHFEKFIGNDGDGVDVFIGEWPESTLAFVINQNVAGKFDEHKVMLGFTSKQRAIIAYNNSYDKGWNGLQSIVQITIEQLRWWLQYGNKKLPINANLLPFDSGADMNTETLDDVFSGILKEDADGCMLDSVSIEEILLGEELEAFDAIVVPLQKLDRKMQQVMGILKIVAGESVSPVAYQVTEPFRQKGTTNVAAIFEMSDGQTVSIFFHNPDVTPNKINPADELISWKWVLNKKDVTILVAPEKGRDLNVREVSRRIMKIVEKNSDRFTKANADKASRIESINTLKATIALKEKQLADIDAEIAKLEVEKAITDNNSSDNQTFNENFKIGDFVQAKWASLNKNNTIDEYRKEVDKGEYSTGISKIESIKNLTTDEYDDYKNNLMRTESGLSGGSQTDDPYFDGKNLISLNDADRARAMSTIYSTVTLITAQNREPFLVDSQGYDYARYVGLDISSSSNPYKGNDSVKEEKHYSELILDELKNNFGWIGSIETGSIQKTFKLESRAGGALNPNGETIITASFDDRGRYLTAYSGFDVLTDMDMRDYGFKEIYALAAKAFDEKVLSVLAGGGEKSKDMEFVQSAIEGQLSFFDKSVTDKLAEISKKYSDGAVNDLLLIAKQKILDFFKEEFALKTNEVA